MWHRGRVEITCWSDRGETCSIRAPDPDERALVALRSALEAVRTGDRTDRAVAIELPSPVSGAIRGLARLVLGVGAVVVTTMLMALVVVGSDTREALLVALVVVTLAAGVFVGVVWRRDVSLTVLHDGHLRRTGWGGFTDVNVRDYERVTVEWASTGGAAAGQSEPLT